MIQKWKLFQVSKVQKRKSKNVNGCEMVKVIVLWGVHGVNEEDRGRRRECLAMSLEGWYMHAGRCIQQGKAHKWTLISLCQILAGKHSSIHKHVYVHINTYGSHWCIHIWTDTDTEWCLSYAYIHMHLHTHVHDTHADSGHTQT